MGYKVGLALGGGGAKGLAHLGAIRKLKYHGIPIDIITGTSIGAIIGGLFASTPDIDYVIDRVSTFLNSNAFNKTQLEFIKRGQQKGSGIISHLSSMLKTGLFLNVYLKQPSFISKETLQSNLAKLLPEMNIEACDIPLGLVTLSLNDCKAVEIQSGNLIESVMASCAIPGIFPPIEIGGKMMVDGGWVTPVPIQLAKSMGADFIIAIDVAPESNIPFYPKSAWEISQKANEIARNQLKTGQLTQANELIKVDLNDLHWADFLSIEKCIIAGEKSVNDSIEKIKKSIFKHKLRQIITHPFAFSH